MVLDQADRLFAGEVTVEQLGAADRGEWPAAAWEAIEHTGLPLALVPEAQGAIFRFSESSFSSRCLGGSVTCSINSTTRASPIFREAPRPTGRCPRVCRADSRRPR